MISYVEIVSKTILRILHGDPAVLPDILPPLSTVKPVVLQRNYLNNVKAHTLCSLGKIKACYYGDINFY